MKDSGFEMNKIAAAVLLAGIIAMVAGIVAEGLYTGSFVETEKEVKRGYTIAGAENTGAEAAAAPADEKPVDITPFLAKADAKAGEAVSKKCASCHSFEKGGKNGVGPNQWDLVGSTFAHKEDYTYSSALSALHGKKNWGFQELSEFLAAPSKYVPGTKMSFAGVKDPKDRANLIAWLNTMTDHPAPLPK